MVHKRFPGHGRVGGEGGMASEDWREPGRWVLGAYQSNSLASRVVGDGEQSLTRGVGKTKDTVSVRWYEGGGSHVATEPCASTTGGKLLWCSEVLQVVLPHALPLRARSGLLEAATSTGRVTSRGGTVQLPTPKASCHIAIVAFNETGPLLCLLGCAVVACSGEDLEG